MRRPVTTEGAIPIGHPLSTGQGGGPTRYEHDEPCPGYGDHRCGAIVSPYSPGPRCWLCERRKDFAETAAPDPNYESDYERRLAEHRQRYFDALPGNAATVGKRLGVSAERARENLGKYFRLGLITRTGTPGNGRRRGSSGYVYHRKDDG